MTRSRLDRAVVARYYGFLVISQLIIFTLIGVLYRTYHIFFLRLSWTLNSVLCLESIALVVLEIGRHKSASEILKNVDSTPL